MGGTSSSNQTQSSTTAPWTAAQPTLSGILGQLNPLVGNSGLNPTESNAIGGITNAASTPNPYAPAIGANASKLLGGGGAMAQAPNVTNELNTYQGQTNPLASNTDYNPLNTPGLSTALQYMQNQVGSGINGQFAAAGRDGSPANSQSYGYGVTSALAPILTGQYNQNVQNQQGAANNLLQAGYGSNALLSGMQQQANANTQVGTQAATDAWNAQIQPYQQQLAAQQAGQQIPAQNLGLLAQIGVPIAGLGSQSTGQSNGTQQMSVAQQFGLIAQGLGQFIPKGPLTFNGGG